MSPITIVLNSKKSLACVTAAVQSSMLNVHASAEPDQPLETVTSLPQANSRLHTSAITQLWKGWAVPMPFHSHSERNTYRWDIKEVQLHLHDNRGPRRKINARWSFNMESSHSRSADFTDAFVCLCELWLSNRDCFLTSRTCYCKGLK